MWKFVQGQDFMLIAKRGSGSPEERRWGEVAPVLVVFDNNTRNRDQLTLRWRRIAVDRTKTGSSSVWVSRQASQCAYLVHLIILKSMKSLLLTTPELFIKAFTVQLGRENRGSSHPSGSRWRSCTRCQSARSSIMPRQLSFSHFSPCKDAQVTLLSLWIQGSKLYEIFMRHRTIRFWRSNATRRTPLLCTITNLKGQIGVSTNLDTKTEGPDNWRHCSLKKTSPRWRGSSLYEFRHENRGTR